jgi:O-antigen/teichoic acid export membrane protein
MKKIFLKDVGIVTIAQIVVGLSALLYTIITSRLLGVADYGLFQAVIALFASVSVFNLSLNLATTHGVGVSEDHIKPRIVGEFLWIAMLVGGLSAIIIIGLSPWLKNIINTESQFPILCLSLMIVARAVLTTFYGALQGNNRYSSFSAAKIIESLICLGVGTALIVAGAGVSGALLGYVLSMLIVIVVFFLFEAIFVNYKKVFFVLKMKYVL